jgi:hypothetical protein
METPPMTRKRTDDRAVRDCGVGRISTPNRTGWPLTRIVCQPNGARTTAQGVDVRPAAGSSPSARSASVRARRR